MGDAVALRNHPASQSDAPLAAHLVVTPEPEAHEQEVARRLLTGEAHGDASREAVVDAARG
jgi:hypothetical protein